MNWLVDDEHDEPSNEELGIKPHFKRRWIVFSVWIAQGLVGWAILIGAGYLMFG